MNCRSGGDGMQELIVITLLVAVQGKLQLPKITSREELVTALNRLGGVREDQAQTLLMYPLLCLDEHKEYVWHFLSWVSCVQRELRLV